MIFDQERLQMQLIDIVRLDETNTVTETRARPFFAMSLRLDNCDTEIRIPYRTLHLQSHDLTLFPSNLAYTRVSREEHMIVFHFSMPNSMPHNPEDRLFPKVFREIPFSMAEPLFTEAYQIWSDRKQGYFYRCSAQLYSIAAMIQSQIKKTEHAGSPIVETALAYIRAHAQDSGLTVAEIAGICHISTSYLRTCFCRELGVTPKVYLDAFRMSQARSLLIEGQDSVADVAFKTGYRDPKNFATAFKKQFGYPPSAQKYEDFL